MTATAIENGLEIKGKDVALVKLGTKSTKGALKNARRLNASLGLDVKGAETLENQVGAVCDLIEQRGEESDASLVLPAHLVSAARIGVALQYGKTVSEQEKLQDDFELEDTRGIDSRAKQLDRLLKDLGGTPELELNDDED